MGGGFLEFQATFPALCESKSVDHKGIHASLTSMSQPCLPVSNVGPTRILPFLYLGSQNDALSQETMQKNGINYVLNVSLNCPKPPFIQEGHFIRIPVNDNYSAKLLPHFHKAFQYLDKVREANGCVLVHCLAGISRSPTLAIAYIMQHYSMTSEEAYRYVKDKRPTISPNFNFLGQLLEYEKQMKRYCSPLVTPLPFPPTATPTPTNQDSPLSWPNPKTSPFSTIQESSSLNAQSPTTALAKLNFDQPLTPEAAPSKSSETSVSPFFPPTRTQLPSPKIPAFKSATLPASIGCSLRERLSLTRVQKRSSSPASTSFGSKTADDLSIGHVPSSDMISSFPTTSLDQLNFTPCFALDESKSKTSGIKRPHSTNTGISQLQTVESKSESGSVTGKRSWGVGMTESTTPKESVSHASGTDRTTIAANPSRSNSNNTSPGLKTTGTKRPLDFGKPLESTHVSGTKSPTAPSPMSPSLINTGDSQVKLRSPENRAKRQLVRPNSIAFSTYPSFDLGCNGSDSSTSNSPDTKAPKSSNMDMETCKKKLLLESKKYTNGASTMQTFASNVALETVLGKSRLFEHCRKSRSLDDILSSPEDERKHASCGCIKKKMSKSSLLKSAMVADLFPQTMGLEHVQCRCRGASDPHHQSNSSISSSSSHNSLHGSVEIIQVS
ncbi:dual specificity protein phosphatase 16 isoform X2 [Lingula anatina]|uniref:protein-tyrosine-phosphatase n=1 Tax=Lingula anatina TaxID=7574 RepID=A0A1S3HEM0_LINAN|nr:dual specificity protein phosphatase 16 isoform X2 [Lingula anatina]|eukprot:XP_013383484.1 dual specificity protein phosphatase 16 isoform X2 [Lingula anatina]